MKMRDYIISKEEAHCNMCLKHTSTAEIKINENTLNICNTCLDNLKEIF
jgi:ribosome-binding protein aMBF1 (putative translation factor)